MMITLALAVAIIAGLVVWLIMKVDICLRQDVSTHHELKHMLDRIDAHYEIVMHHVVRVDELETKNLIKKHSTFHLVLRTLPLYLFRYLQA